MKDEEKTAAGGRMARWWPSVLIAVFVFVFFADSFLAGKAPVMRDTLMDFMPWRMFAREAFRAGVLPLWNHYSDCGQPFMAEPQSAFFYPPNLLFYLLPPVFALKVWLALHLTLAGLFMYALGRHWRLQVAPSLIAAIAFAFGMHMIASMEYQSLLGALVWSPLGVLLVSRMIEIWGESRGGKNTAAGLIANSLLLAIVLAVQFLAGHQQALLYSLFIDAVYLVIACIMLRDAKALIACGLACCVAGALAIGLSAIQFLLTLQMIPLSMRAFEFDPGLGQASLHPRMFLCWLMPFLAGRPGHWWGGNLSIAEFWLGTCYVGIAPLVLASFIVPRLARGDRDRRVSAISIFLLMTIAIGLVMSMGQYTPVYMWCWRHLPLIDKFRWPTKFLQLVAFGLPLLGAIGLQGLMDNGGARERRIRAIVFACWLALFTSMLVAWAIWRDSPSFYDWLTGGAFLSRPRRPEDIAILSGDLGLAALYLGLTLIALIPLLMDKIPIRGRQSIALALVLIAFTNLTLGRKIHPILSDKIYRTSTPPAKILDQTNPGRFFLSEPNYQAFSYGLEDPSVYELMKEAGTGEIWLPARVFKIEGTGTLTLFDYYKIMHSLRALPFDDPQWQRIANLLNMRYFMQAPDIRKLLGGVASTELHLIENPSAMPRAMVAGSWFIKKPNEEPHDRLYAPGFDIYRSILVDAVPNGWPADSLNAGGPGEPAIEKIEYGWNRVEVIANCTGRSFLYLGDVLDPNWHATVNGKNAPIYKANFIFRAVPLEAAGVHRVVFEYKPPQVWIGLITTTATMIVILALASWCWGVRRVSAARATASCSCSCSCS